MLDQYSQTNHCSSATWKLGLLVAYPRFLELVKISSKLNLPITTTTMNSILLRLVATSFAPLFSAFEIKNYFKVSFLKSFIQFPQNYMVLMSQSGFRAIMQKNMEALWFIIESEIGLFCLNNIPKPTIAPVPSGTLSNIFETGENFVKVESLDINSNRGELYNILAVLDQGS